MIQYEEIGRGMLRSAVTTLGQWTIKPPNSVNDCARISFRPNLGKDFMEMYNEAKALKALLESQGEDPYKHIEYWYATNAYSPTDDLMTFETLHEASHIIEFIETLTGPIPPWQDTISGMGFEQAYDPVRHPKLRNLLHLKSNKKFSLSLGEGPVERMWLRYEPSGSSWNNLAVLAAVKQAHDRTSLIPNWWPQNYPALDLMALIVERIVLIRNTVTKQPRFKPKHPIPL